MDHGHIPVLLEEVRKALQPKPGSHFIDGTLGAGGHATMLLQASAPNGRVLGIERDSRNLMLAQEQLAVFGERAVLIQGNYRFMDRLAQANGFRGVDGVLLDVGFSSLHVDQAERGFSFLHDGPLDMRYDSGDQETAEHIVNTWSAEDLTWLFRTYGEEPRAYRIAQGIVDARRKSPFLRTLALAEYVEKLVPRHGRLHPATRIFQALRIAVNDELGALQDGLSSAWTCLKPGGVLAVISFHSLEDRLVKRFFRGLGPLAEPLTKRPVIATEREQELNPRARSAKLRSARKI